MPVLKGQTKGVTPVQHRTTATNTPTLTTAKIRCRVLTGKLFFMPVIIKLFNSITTLFNLQGDKLPGTDRTFMCLLINPLFMRREETR